MRVLVNALAITNFSGRTVLLGFLSHLAPTAADPNFRLTVLHRRDQDFPELGNHVEWHECPPATSRWPTRTAWETLHLGRAARAVGADVILSMSGASVGALPVPEVVYAMNPWALVTEVQTTWRERLKASLQRAGYRRASGAAGAVFISEFLRQAYRGNADGEPATATVAYPGIDGDVRLAAARESNRPRQPGQIVCVSVMAPHKDLETLVRAVGSVRRTVPAVRLVLAGPWPDAEYRKAVERTIVDMALADAVTVRGEVSPQDLYRLYAESQVFALTSRCESFGFPAVEAQSFGTPVVAARCCAVPEVCADGGLFVPAGDVEATAEAIRSLVSDPCSWSRISEGARRNALRFRWEDGASRLRSVLGSVASTSAPVQL
jgi:glycosyltransferase involved in cell wall biosynthesis